MRICLLSPEYLSGPHGGIATYTHNLAQGLTHLGHRVMVVTRGTGGEYLDGHVNICELDIPPRARLPFGNRYFGNTLAAWPFIQGCKSRLAGVELDIVESPEWLAGGIGIALEGKVPVIARLHTHLKLVKRLNGQGWDLDTLMMSWMERTLMMKARRIIANSHMLAQVCARDLGLPLSRIEVLPLGIDCQRFRPQESRFRARLGIGDRPLVLFSGRLEQRKGIDTLLRAFEQVTLRFPDAVLALAGASTCTAPGEKDFKGEIEQRYQAWIETGRLRILGAIPYEELPDVYAGCELLAVPSPFEAFGMVYLEAMACGKPVIGCLTGGAPEVIQDGHTGFLVPPSDPASLGERLIQLLGSEELRARMGIHGRDYVLENFEQSRIARRTVETYGQVLEERGGYARTA